MPRRLGDAHAQGAGAELGAGLLHVAQAGLDPPDEHLRFGRLRHRQDDEELVAAESPDHVEGPALLPEDLGHLDQQAIAGGVTHRVVDRLEPVEVEQQDAGVELVAQAPGDLRRKPLLQRATIVEAGELIRGGGAVELLDQLRVLERDRGRERERARQFELRPAIQLVADPRAQNQDRHPLGAGIERDHQLGTGPDQRGDRDIVGAGGCASGRQCLVERDTVDRGGPEPVVE